MRFALLFLWAGVMLAQTLDADAEAFIEERFRAAKMAEARSDFEQAEAEYRRILDKYPKAIPEIYQNLGLVYYLQRKYPEAVRAFDAGLKLKSGMTGARLFLGASYVYLGQPETALPHLEQAHRSNPSLESSSYLGLANLALRRYDAAVPYFRRALEIADDKADYLYLVGDAYLKLSEQVANNLAARNPGSEYDQFITARILDGQEFYQVAARHYMLSAQKDPWNASVLFLLARALAVMGQDEPSRLALERYRQLMPSDRRAHVALGEAPRKDPAEVGLKVDFAADLRALPAIDRTNRPVLALLPSSMNPELVSHLEGSSAWKAVVDRLAQGQWAAALQSLEKVPGTRDSWLPAYLRAIVHYWNDDYRKAEEIVASPSFAALEHPAAQLLRWQVFHQLSLHHFQRLLDEHPASSRALFVKARILHAQGSKEAFDEYQAAIAAGPRDPGIRTALADYLLSNSKYQEAIEACQGELAINPYSLEAKSILGRIYTQLRRPDQALPFLEAVLAADPSHAEARSDYARCYELKGDLEKALTEYRRALENDPGLNRLHYVLARLYRQLGKPDLAEREFEIFNRNEAAERARGRRLREEQSGP